MEKLTVPQAIFLRKMLKLRRKHKDNHDPEMAANDIDTLYEETLTNAGFGAGVKIAKDIYVYR